MIEAMSRFNIASAWHQDVTKFCSHFPQCENYEKWLKLKSFWAKKRELEQNFMKVFAHFILLMWNFAQFFDNFFSNIIKGFWLSWVALSYWLILFLLKQIVCLNSNKSWKLALVFVTKIDWSLFALTVVNNSFSKI